MDPSDLDGVSLFRGVSPAARALLSDRGVVRSCAAGTVVWRAGAPSRGLYVLLRGRVRAVRVRDGREVVVHRSGPGATLGEIPLFDEGGYPATLVAETDTTFLVVDRALLENLVVREPAVAWRLLETLGGRVRELADRLEAVTAGSVASRLAAYILERAADSPGDFVLGMTQQGLAAELGTVREVVSRGLADLVSEGVLARTGRARYRLERPAVLRARASVGVGSSQQSPPPLSCP